MSTPTQNPIATIERLSAFEGQSVTLQGWLHNKRSKGKLHFVQLRDGTGFVQCVVVQRNVTPELFEAIGGCGQESSLRLVGNVKADERAPGGYELEVTGGEVLQVSEGFPITPKEHGPDFLLSQRHLWLRSRRQWAILRIRDEVIWALRGFFHGRGFLNMDAPMFTPNACEGTSDLFEVSYFERSAYLTQSGQLYGEAGAAAFGKIYTLGPTFRAEKSKTRRHLTEFWMLEPEVAFADLDEVIQLAEDMVVHTVGEVLAHRATELEVLERDRSKLEAIRGPFPRITYDEAAALLKEAPDCSFTYGDDFGAPDETWLSSRFDRPVFVTHYPAAVKSFYMKRDPADPGKALCMDLLGSEGVGELIGGSQREDDLAELEARIREHELPEEYFQWYLDLRRYGSVPHSGYGLGLERFVAWIAGVEHIRECIPFPRTIYRMEP